MVNSSEPVTVVFLFDELLKFFAIPFLKYTSTLSETTVVAVPFLPSTSFITVVVGASSGTSTFVLYSNTTVSKLFESAESVIVYVLSFLTAPLALTASPSL